MKIKIINGLYVKACLLLLMGFAGQVWAQPGIDVHDISGTPGSTITVNIDYLSDGNDKSPSFDFDYDAAILTVVSCNPVDLVLDGGGSLTPTCANPGPDNTNSIRVGAFNFTPNNVSAGTQPILEVVFTINAAAVPGTTLLTLNDVQFAPSGATGVGTGNSDGTVTIVAGPQPDYSSAPVGATTIALNGSIGTNPTSDVVITNAGPAGAPDLTGSCALSGVDAALFSIVSGSPFTVAQAANSTVTVDCDATAATMAQLNASLDCTHNGDGTTEASPVSYPLTCDIAAISPQYNSTPAGGSAIAMGSILQGGTNPTATIDVDNDAGDATTTLTGTCTAPAPFIVTNGAFSVLQGAAAATVDIACDATAMPAAYAEDLTCTHNGSNASPVTYPMTCEVLAGPQPDYSSAPVGGTVIALNGSIGTNPTSDVVITNAGPAGAPDLTGSCALSGVDAALFSIVSGSPFTVAQAANSTVTVDCDATAATMAQLNASLDCTHNGDGTTEASPVSYPLTCDIAAISPQYNSTPAGGSAIAMGSILQGGTNPTATIDVDNDAGDATTTLTGTCTAPAPFIVTNGAFSVLQGAAAATVDIACDATAMPAAYAEDLTCTHNGSNASPVTYPMTCEVLAAAATGSQSIPNGTDLNVVVPPSGSGTTTVVFSEVGGQGVAITDLNCTITPGVGFDITSPGIFPATVPAAGSLPVIVTFTDPGDGSATDGSLDCTYTDGGGNQAVSYPLIFAIRAINVPTLSMMGYLVLTLGFGLIGFFAFRRRA